MRYFYVLAAVIAAAAVAYFVVVPNSAIEERDDPARTEGEGEVGEAGSAVPPASTGDRAQENTTIEASQPPEIGEVSLDELPFEGACGLFLGRAGDDSYVFVNAVTQQGDGENDEPAVAASMRIDGDLVTVQRIRGDGDELEAEQYPRQIFEDDTSELIIVVEIEAQGVAVPAGEITVMKPGRSTAKFPVEGRVGC